MLRTFDKHDSSSLIRPRFKITEERAIVSVLSYNSEFNYDYNSGLMQPVLLIEHMMRGAELFFFKHLLDGSYRLEVHPGKIERFRGGYHFMSYGVNPSSINPLINSMLENRKDSKVFEQPYPEDDIYRFFKQELGTILPDIILPENYELFLDEGCAKSANTNDFRVSGFEGYGVRLCNSVAEQLAEDQPKYNDLSQVDNIHIKSARFMP